MKKEIKLNRNDDKKLYLLGAYQIGGGIYGAILILFTLGNIEIFFLGKIAITIFGLILFLFSAYCGYLLIREKFLKGLNLSIFNNALQIIGFGITGYNFKFVSGFFAGLTLDLTNDVFAGLGFDFSIISLALGSSSESIFIHINIFAILVVLFIFKIKEKLERKINLIPLEN